MKKALILLSMMMMTILTGCMSVDITVDIEKDGTGKMVMEMLGDDYLITEMSEADFADFDEVERISGAGQTGFRATDYLDGKVDLENVVPNDVVNIKKEGGMLSNTYVIDVKLNDVMYSEMTQDDMAMLSMVGSSVPLNFNIKSPIEFEETNATNVVEVDGKTVYSWNYDLANVDNIYIKAKMPNIMGMIGVVGLVIVVIIAVIGLKKKRNKVRFEEEIDEDFEDFEDNFDNDNE